MIRISAATPPRMCSNVHLNNTHFSCLSFKQNLSVQAWKKVAPLTMLNLVSQEQPPSCFLTLLLMVPSHQKQRKISCWTNVSAKYLLELTVSSSHTVRLHISVMSSLNSSAKTPQHPIVDQIFFVIILPYQPHCGLLHWYSLLNV